MVRRIAATGLLTLALTTSASAQGLRDEFTNLFTFGDCGVPLCLGGITAASGHGAHFIPAAATTGQIALGFMTNAIATTVSSAPIPTASGGFVFEFIDGLPVRTELSGGPIFGERARTLGKGQLLAGVLGTITSVASIRGIPIDNLQFNFGHDDLAPAGLGDPNIENDIIAVRTDLSVDVIISTAYASFGLLENVDIGVAVPFVRVDAKGQSVAQILPIGTFSNPLHFFSGSSAEPVLVGVAEADGSATGIGDVAARVKIGLKQSGNILLAVLGDVRLPTGAEEDLLGTGKVAVRGMFIGSARWGAFTPHINAGYFFRNAEFQTDAVLFTAGFDQLLSPWATLAVDIVTEWQVGDSPLEVSPDIVYVFPWARSIESTLIPDRRDNSLTGSIGFKFDTSDKLSLVVNSLVPLGNGGIQSTAGWTAGLEFHF